MMTSQLERFRRLFKRAERLPIAKYNNNQSGGFYQAEQKLNQAFEKVLNYLVYTNSYQNMMLNHIELFFGFNIVVQQEYTKEHPTQILTNCYLVEEKQ